MVLYNNGWHDGRQTVGFRFIKTDSGSIGESLSEDCRKADLAMPFRAYLVAPQPPGVSGTLTAKGKLNPQDNP